MCCKAFIWFAMSDLLFFFSTFLYFCASGLSFIIANKNDFRWIISNYRSMLRKHLSLLYCTVFSLSFATFDCCKNFTKIDFQYFYFILETKYKSPSFFWQSSIVRVYKCCKWNSKSEIFLFFKLFRSGSEFCFLNTLSLKQSPTKFVKHFSAIGNETKTNLKLKMRQPVIILYRFGLFNLWLLASNSKLSFIGFLVNCKCTKYSTKHKKNFRHTFWVDTILIVNMINDVQK